MVYHVYIYALNGTYIRVQLDGEILYTFDFVKRRVVGVVEDIERFSMLEVLGICIYGQWFIQVANQSFIYLSAFRVGEGGI